MVGEVRGTGCAVLSSCVRMGGRNKAKSVNPGHGQSVTFPGGGQAGRSWLRDTGDGFCCDESGLRSVVASNQL